MKIESGSTDNYIYFVAVDATDFATRETGLSSFTVYRSRNGAAAAAFTTPTINEVDATNMPGVYELLLDEDTTIAAGNDTEEMVLHITASGMAPVTRTIELYRPKFTVGSTLSLADINAQCDTAISDAALATASALATVDSNVDAILVDTGTTLPGTLATLATSSALATVDANVDAILVDTNELQTNQGNWVTATGFATASALTTVEGKIDTIDTVVDGIQADLSNGTDGLGAIKTAVDAIPTSNPSAASIADAVWTEAIADHSATVGSTAEALENAGAAGTPPTAAAIADAVWDEALSGHLTAGSTGASLNAAGSAGDPWTTTLPGSYTGSQAGKILADVLVDTAEIGAAGAGLTAVPWNAAWDAEVQSEVTDALNAYDPPTRAELTSDIGTVTTAISGLNDLDAAGVRAAVGLAAANLDTQLGTIDTNVDAVLVDTGTTLPASIATVDSNVDAILVDTDTTIPGLIASLNDLDAAAIRTAVGLASANLDTQLDAIPTAVENADALLNRDMSAVSDTTARSPLNALRALRNRVDASASPATVYKEDDTTAAWTTTVTTDADANNIVESNPA